MKVFIVVLMLLGLIQGAKCLEEMTLNECTGELLPCKHHDTTETHSYFGRNVIVGITVQLPYHQINELLLNDTKIALVYPDGNAFSQGKCFLTEQDNKEYRLDLNFKKLIISSGCNEWKHWGELDLILHTTNANSVHTRYLHLEIRLQNIIYKTTDTYWMPMMDNRKKQLEAWQKPGMEVLQEQMEAWQKQLMEAWQKGQKRLEEGQQQLKEGQQQLKEGQQQLEAGQQQLEAGQQQLEAGQQQLKGGQQQLEAGQQQLEAGQQQLEARQQQLKEGQQQLEARQQQLEAGQQQLKAGQQQMEAGQQQLKEGQQQMGAGQQQLEAGQQQLKGGQQQLEAGQQQMEAKHDTMQLGISAMNNDVDGIKYAVNNGSNILLILATIIGTCITGLSILYCLWNRDKLHHHPHYSIANAYFDRNNHSQHAELEE